MVIRALVTEGAQAFFGHTVEKADLGPPTFSGKKGQNGFRRMGPLTFKSITTALIR